MANTREKDYRDRLHDWFSLYLRLLPAGAVLGIANAVLAIEIMGNEMFIVPAILFGIFGTPIIILGLARKN